MKYMSPVNDHRWLFRFFVSEKNQKIDRTLAMLKEICEQHLEGAYDIEVIDITEDPVAGMEENILATPTLLKKIPKPARRIIGDLLDRESLLLHLDILEKE